MLRKTYRKANSNVILALAAGLLTTPIVQAQSPYEDEWSRGFKHYASQLGDSALAQSILNYASQHERLLQQHGYIGRVLPIPAIEQVAPGVFFVKGALMWGTLENFGLNNNITAVELESGIFVYNTGSNPAVAYSFHQKLQRHTSMPIKWLAIENYQSHANLGASYWMDVGVRNLYSEQAAADFWQTRGFDRAVQRVSEYGPLLIQPVRNVADRYTRFEDRLIINEGTGDEVHLVNFGGGHTPTMTGAFIPSKNILFTGDLGFVERLPGLLHGSSYSEWLASFERMVDYVTAHSPDLDNLLVIPGHGGATNLTELTRQTYDYFKDLEAVVKQAIANGVARQDLAQHVAMPDYQDRPMYSQLFLRNALSVFDEITTGQVSDPTLADE